MIDLKNKYPHISKSLDGVKNMVSILRKRPDLELEARLGIFNLNRFTSGVPRTEIERLIDMLQDSTHISCESKEWTEEQDFFYTFENVQYRTRVHYDASDMTLKSHTIKKENVAKFDIICQPEVDPKIDVRVSLKKEETVNNDPNICVGTSMVRIKQRKRFKTLCNRWAFDFSMSWSGQNKTDAEMKQSSEDPVFEIECELIDAKPYLAMHNDEYIACSLLLKVHDLLRYEKIEFVPFSRVS